VPRRQRRRWLVGCCGRGKHWVNQNILRLDDSDIPENLSVHNEETIKAEADRLGLTGWERVQVQSARTRRRPASGS
jgi:hypothetical protein